MEILIRYRKFDNQLKKLAKCNRNTGTKEKHDESRKEVHRLLSSERDRVRVQIDERQTREAREEEGDAEPETATDHEHVANNVSVRQLGDVVQQSDGHREEKEAAQVAQVGPEPVALVRHVIPNPL